jgi:hypothetical protein
MIKFLKALIATIQEAATNSRRHYILRVTFFLLRYVQQETLSQPVLLYSSGTDINSLGVCVLEWNANFLLSIQNILTSQCLLRIYVLFT